MFAHNVTPCYLTGAVVLGAGGAATGLAAGGTIGAAIGVRSLE